MKNYKLIPMITLWVLLLIGLVAAVMFYVGGSAGSMEVAGDYLDIPTFTNVFLIWNYILVGLVVLATLVVVVWRFVEMLMVDVKGALTSLGVVLGFVAIVLGCWVAGSADEVKILGYEGTDNVGAMAQLSDAMLYLCYVLVCGTFVTMIWGIIRSKLLK